MEKIAVILAGGRGSRMALKTSKVLAPICCKPILSYIIESLKNIDFAQKFIVLGENLAEVRPFLPPDIKVVIQPEPLGTGNAFMCACKHFADFMGEVLLLNGDGPIIDESSIRQILALNGAKMSIFTGFLPQNKQLGRIKRKNGQVCGIVEAKDCSPKDKKIMEKNLGIYCFDNRILQKFIYNLNCKNAQNEYYVTDLVEIFAKNHHKIRTFSQNNDDFYIPSVNTLLELTACQKIMQSHINNRWIENGVNILYPDNTYIDGNSQIGKFTTIYPNSSIVNSKIGENCVICANCVIENSEVKNGCVIGSNSVIKNSKISTKIAPLSFVNESKK